jgi:hypothetical protein
MDLLNRYCSRVGGTTRTDIVGVQKGFHATPRKTAYGKSSKTLSAIQLTDQKLWTFSAGTMVASEVRPERKSSAWSRDSPQLQGKQPTDTPLNIWERFNGRIKSDGSFQLVLWSREWYNPNVHRRCGVGIPRYSKENSLQKVLKNFKRDPTVGSKVMDLFRRNIGRVGGTTRTDIVSME